MAGYDDTITEAALKAAVLAGNEQVWRQLYVAHFQRLYAYVHFRTALNPERTEEIVQECWMIAVRRIQRFEPEKGTFYQWICGIANHLLLNAARKHVRRAAWDQSTAALAESSARSIQLSDQIAAANAMLPPRHREVLRAKYEQELSVSDIAREWGETTKAVESLLSRARESFREAFQRLDQQGQE